MMRIQFNFYLLFIFLAFSASPSFAQNYYSNLGIYKDIVEDKKEEFFGNFSPKILNRLVIDGNFDRSFKATRKNDKFIETSGKVRFFNNIHLNKSISINSYLKFQDVNGLNPLTQNAGNQNNGKDRYFKNLGLFAEEINLRYLYENTERKIANNLI